MSPFKVEARALVVLAAIAVSGPLSARDDPPAAGPARAALAEFSKGWDESAWTAPRLFGRFGAFMRPLEDSGWQARMRALQKLARAGEEAVPALVAALGEGDVPTRILAAQALGYLSPHAPREALERAIASDESAAVRLHAVDALGMQGGDVSSFLESRRKSERSRDVRRHIDYALGRGGRPVDPGVIETLARWKPGSMATARVGAPAPDFELSTVGGKQVRLGDFRGKRRVVLVFVYGDT